jgi:hypothetical protein
MAVLTARGISLCYELPGNPVNTPVLLISGLAGLGLAGDRGSAGSPSGTM